MTKQTTIDPTAIPNAPLPNLDVVQSKLNSGLAKAQDVTDRVLAYGRGNIDATLQSNRIWADGTRTILDRVLSAVKDSRPPDRRDWQGPGRGALTGGVCRGAGKRRAPRAGTGFDRDPGADRDCQWLAKQSLIVIADRADAASAIFKHAA
jgi:hypothetical protein